MTESLKVSPFSTRNVSYIIYFHLLNRRVLYFPLQLNIFFVSVKTLLLEMSFIFISCFVFHITTSTAYKWWNSGRIRYSDFGFRESQIQFQAICHTVLHFWIVVLKIIFHLYQLSTRGIHSFSIFTIGNDGIASYVVFRAIHPNTSFLAINWIHP